MEIVTTIETLRQKIRAARLAAKYVGLVPTMGALHAGHGSLISRAVEECDLVVVSIFVNPTQFGPQEDLSRYPRTLEADCKYCEKLGAHVIFAPSDAEMYPQEQRAWVDVEKLTDGLCGARRPGHFRGVATVCTKLFNIVRPDFAYFGQKDAQQAAVICRMVKDLNLPLEIRVCPIVRDKDGLALSSRNQYLSKEERKKAICLYRSLEKCRELVGGGLRNVSAIRREMEVFFQQPGVALEYIEVADPQTLEGLSEITAGALVAVAAVVGTTRLIDNLRIDLQTP
jgi:pantoate--beta-alanine ligase